MIQQIILVLALVLTLSIAKERPEIPWLGLGTAAMGGNCESIVFKALAYGVRLIDTAQASEWYDEASVGKAVQTYEHQYEDYLQTHQESITIVTKIHPRSYSYRDMDLKLAESTRNFGSHRLDVVLLHAPFCWQGHCTPAQEKFTWRVGWKNLELLQEKYHIKYIGVSNFHLSQLNELLTQVASTADRVQVIQNWMDPFHQDKDIRSVTNKHNIAYMAYSSFGTQWEYSKLHANPVWENRILKQLASRYETNIAMIVLSWLWQENVIAIPRSTKVTHLQENFQYYYCQVHSDVCEERGWQKQGKRLFPIVFTVEEMKDIRGLDESLGTPWD